MVFMQQQGSMGNLGWVFCGPFKCCAEDYGGDCGGVVTLFRSHTGGSGCVRRRFNKVSEHGGVPSSCALCQPTVSPRLSPPHWAVAPHRSLSLHHVKASRSIPPRVRVNVLWPRASPLPPPPSPLHPCNPTIPLALQSAAPALPFPARRHHPNSHPSAPRVPGLG